MRTTADTRFGFAYIPAFTCARTLFRRDGRRSPPDATPSARYPGKRPLGAVLVSIPCQIGTAIGTRNAIRFFVGEEVIAITAYAAVSFELGEAELGVDWVMSPSGRFARYAFDVHVAVALTTEQRR